VLSYDSPLNMNGGDCGIIRVQLLCNGWINWL
jgi:hypothetical protein